MRKRILQLRSSGAFLGAENVVVELARQSPRFGFESVIGLPNDVNDPIPELKTVADGYGLQTELFPCRGRFDPGLLGRLRSFVRRERIDLVHCHGYKEDFYALLGRLGVPLLATNHLWKRTTPSLALYARLDGFLLRYFDHVIAVSEPIRQEMAAGGVAEHKLSKIPNGIDLERFEVATPARARERKRELGLREDAACLGMISSLTPEKGHRYALEALTELVTAQPQTQLLVVGDGPERERLDQQVHARGLEAHVVFAGRRSDIPRLLDAVDIFLLPSLKEGLPIALLEAMAAARPVVASDVGDVATAVRHGATGLLTPPGDSAALAQALNSLLRAPAEAARLGANARESIAQTFSSQAMAQAYCELYKQQLAVA